MDAIAEKTSTKLLQVRLDRDLAEKAREKAEMQGLTLTQVVRFLLKEYAENPQGKLILN